MIRNVFTATNTTDDDGNPTGGRVAGLGFEINWQAGPLREPDGTERKPNGAFVEDVLEACLQRLQFFASGKFPSRQNSLAITKLEEALFWLDDRTRERQRRGVEGTHSA